MSAEDAKVGDKVYVYQPQGKRFIATVIAVGDGGALLFDVDGKKDQLIGFEWELVDTSSSDYVLEEGQLRDNKVSELTDKQLDSAIKTSQKLFEEVSGQENSMNFWNKLRQLNALKTEKKRRNASNEPAIVSIKPEASETKAGGVTAPSPKPDPSKKTKSGLKGLVDLLENAENLTVNDLLDWVEENGYPFQRNLAEKLRTLPEVQKVQKITTEKKLRDGSDTDYVAGYFDVDSRTLGIDIDKVRAEAEAGVETSDSRLPVIILHEILHAASKDLIANDSKLNEELTAIREQMLEWYKDPANAKLVRKIMSNKKGIKLFEYSLKNNDEMFASFLSDINIGKVYSKIKLDRAEEDVTVFSKIAKSIKKALERFLGKELAPESALNQLLEVTAPILDNAPLGLKLKDSVEGGTPQIKGVMTLEQLYSVNKVLAYFQMDKRKPLVRFENYVETVVAAAKGDMSAIPNLPKQVQDFLVDNLNSENPIDTVAALEHFLDFHTDMSERVDKLVDIADDGFKWSFPIGYLEGENGVLDPNVKSAVIIAAYSYLVEGGTSIGDNFDERSLKRYRGQKQSEKLAYDAYTFVAKLGKMSSEEKKSIGTKALDLLGLDLRQDAPINERDVMQLALGELGLDILLDAGFLYQHTVKTYQLRSEYSSDELKAMAKELKELLSKKSKSPRVAALKQILASETSFVRTAYSLDENGYTVFDDKAAEFSEAVKGTRDTIPSIFGVDSDIPMPTTKPTKQTQKKFKGRKTDLAEEQLEIKKIESSKPLTLISGLFEPETGLFRKMSESFILKMNGFDTRSENDIHVDNRDAVKAKNQNIVRQVKLLWDHVDNVLRGDVTKPFFIDQEIWSIGRMGHKSRGFNAQAHKPHRPFYSMSDWEYTVNSEVPSPNLDLFKLAVLQASGFKLENTTKELALEALEELLYDPDVEAAIEAIIRLEGSVDAKAKPSDEAAILKVVDQWGEGAQSFEALRQLALYTKSKGDFTTTLGMEGDGKNNGPMIALMQMGLRIDYQNRKLVPNKSTRLMEMGGFFRAPTTLGKFAQAGGQDLYKEVARNMSARLVDMSPIVTRALYALGGKFVSENGVDVTSAGRKFFKKPVTGLFFSQAVYTAAKDMADNAIEMFPGLVEEYQGKPEDLLDLIQSLNDLLLPEDKIPEGLPTEDYLSISLTYNQRRALKDAFTETLAGPLDATVNDLFGEYTRSAKVMGATTNFTGSLYIAARNFHKKRLMEEGGNVIKSEKGNILYVQDLTGAQLEELDALTLPLATRVALPMSGKDGQKGLDFNKTGVSTERSHKGYGIKSKYKDGSFVFTGTRFSSPTKFTYEEPRTAVPGFNQSVNSVSAESKPKQFILPRGLVVPGTTHGSDATPMGRTIKEYNVLNTFDGVTVGASQSPKAMKKMNEELLRMFIEYSPLVEVLRSTSGILAAYTELLAANPGSQVLQEGLDDAVSQFNEGRNKGKLRDLTKLLKLTSTRTKAKYNMLANLTTIDQYAAIDSEYTLTPEDRKTIAVAKKEAMAEIDTLIKEYEKNLELLVSAKNGTTEPVNDTMDEYQSDGSVDSPDSVDLPEVGTSPVTPIRTTSEIFDGLNANGAVSTKKANQLKGLLSDIVEKLYGSFGAERLRKYQEIGTSPIDSVVNSIRSETSSFIAKALQAGIVITDAEQYVLEQVHATISASIDTKKNADRELIGIFNKIKQDTTWKDFLPGGTNPTADEIRQAKEVYRFIFSTSNDNGDYLAKFTALASVYEPLRKVLDKNITENLDPTTKKVGDRLTSIGKRLLRAASNTINKTNDKQTAKQKIATLIDVLVSSEAKFQSKLNTPSFDDQVEAAGERLIGKAKQQVKKVLDSKAVSESSVPQIRAVAKLGSMSIEQRSMEYIVLLQKFRNDFYYNAKGKAKPYGLFNELVNEMIGEGDKTAKFFDLLAETQNIGQERLRKFSDHKTELMAQFENQDMDQKTKQALTRVLLKTDLSSLLGTYTEDQIIELISDPEKLEQAVVDLQNKLSKAKNGGFYLNAVEGLAYHMVTGVNTVAVLSRNAHNIAHMFGTPKARTISNADRWMPMIDQLASLRALQLTEETESAGLKQVIEQESKRGNANAIGFVLRFHKGMVDDAFDELFEGRPHNVVKGYTKTLNNPNTAILTAPMADMEDLLAKGYTFHYRASQDPDDPESDVKMGIFTMKDGGLDSFVTGAFTNTAMRSSGASIVGVNTSDTSNATKQWRRFRLRGIEKSRAKEVSAMNKFSGRVSETDMYTNKMMPIFNEDGDVIDYRYTITDATKSELLDSVDDFDLVMANAVSSQFDKISSARVNAELVQELKDFYDADALKNSAGFIRVHKDSEDPKVAEGYRLLPEHTKRAIKEIWGATDGMYVPIELSQMLFGYRNKSIHSLFEKKPGELNRLEAGFVDFMEFILRGKAGIKIKKAGNAWERGVSLVKDIQVIRTGSTLLGNEASNTSLLIWAGVPVDKVFSSRKTAFVSLQDFEKDRAKLAQLEIKAKGMKVVPKAISERIEDIKNRMERNPVKHLIDLNMFQTIMEDIDITKDRNLFPDFGERQLDKITSLTPKLVKPVTDFVFVNQDSLPHDLLLKGTQLSDFLSRYAMYEHLTTRKINPLSEREATTAIRKAFVHYDIPTHPYLEYSNNKGLIFYTKYYLRIQSVLIHLMQNNPVRGLGILMVNAHLKSLPVITDSSMLTRFGNNPFEDGALQLFDSYDDPVIASTLFDVFQ